jgi:putative ABC transport system ATP-binding protein
MIAAEELTFRYNVGQTFLSATRTWQTGMSAPRKSSGEFTLRVPSLEAANGEAVAIVGPSGSGKTTLLHLIAGIRVATSGRLIVNGVEPMKMSDSARRAFRIRSIGLVFQDFCLIDYLNVQDNILLPYRISPALKLDGAVRDRAAGLAEQLGIGDKLRRPISQLSQGEKQRVAISRALLTNPPLVLADEPTGSLDPIAKGRVLDALLNTAKSMGTTVLMVTHDLTLLGRFDRVVDFLTFLAPVKGGEG